MYYDKEMSRPVSNIMHGFHAETGYQPLALSNKSYISNRSIYQNALSLHTNIKRVKWEDQLKWVRQAQVSSKQYLTDQNHCDRSK